MGRIGALRDARVWTGSAAALVMAGCLAGCTGDVADSEIATPPSRENHSTHSSDDEQNGASASGGYPQLEVINDPCSRTCVKGGTIKVKHPTYGPMVVIPYWEKRGKTNDVSAGNAAYGLYQNGRPVGYVEDADPRLLWFADRPVDHGADAGWRLDNHSNVDKYGNVYLSYNGGVAVLTPTDQGYSSYDSMPSGTNAFKNAALHIDKAGEPTLTYSDHGRRTAHRWDGNQFVKKSSGEPDEE